MMKTAKTKTAVKGTKKEATLEKKPQSQVKNLFRCN
jgi:hypothetical protein